MNLCFKTFLLPNGRRALGRDNYRNHLLFNSVEVRNYAHRVKHFKIKEKRSWLSLRSVFTRWTPIGVALYGGWLWNKGITEEMSGVELKCYCHLPLRIFSKFFGKLANTEVPPSARPYVYGKYSSWFNVNLEEAATDDFYHYKSLASFFTRNLKDGAREINKNGCLVSPCDGRVLSFGPVTSCRVEQVKGVTYSLQSFLGKNSWTALENDDMEVSSSFLGSSAAMQGHKDSSKVSKNSQVRDGFVSKPSDNDQYYTSLLKDPERNCLHHCVIYLAPGDYHRFHSPCNWVVKLRRHFSGKLLSVNPVFAKLIPGLFCLNERAVYIGDWKHGFFSYTAVGATNVGSIKVYKDDALHTNGRKKKRCNELVLEPKIDFEVGEMVGQFNMGSTIVLIFEAPRNFEFLLQEGGVVRMGNELGSLKGSPRKKGT